MREESPAFRAMSDVVLAIAAELLVEPILHKLESARDLVGARYAALGVPDGEGEFARFITAGRSDELVAAMGRCRGPTACSGPCSRPPRRAQPRARPALS